MPKHRSSLMRNCVGLLGCLLMAAFFAACNQGSPTQVANSASTNADAAHGSHSTAAPRTDVAQNIPHYFDNPEDAKPFPKTLDPATMKTAATKLAYTTARRIPEVLAQQPCYCYCDKGFGHGSLLDCHIDNHSAD